MGEGWGVSTEGTSVCTRNKLVFPPLSSRLSPSSEHGFVRGGFYFLFFYLNFFIVIQLQLCAFSPHPSTPPQLNPLPSPTSTLPLDFVHVSFIVVPVIPSPHCPLPTPP